MVLSRSQVLQLLHMFRIISVLFVNTLLLLKVTYITFFIWFYLEDSLVVNAFLSKRQLQQGPSFVSFQRFISLFAALYHSFQSVLFSIIENIFNVGFGI